MHGVTGVVDRIATIQSRIDQLSPQRSTSAASFDAALGQALAAQTTTRPGAATSGAGGTPPVGTGLSQVDAKHIPNSLKPYGNGRVPPSALKEIEGVGGHRLWAPAADSFDALRRAAARDGVTIGITDSYRTYDTQVDLVRRKGLYSQGGLAAAPGTSRHGWGIALDLKLDASAQAWMRTHAAEFGFHENVAREPWHWEYEPFTV